MNHYDGPAFFRRKRGKRQENKEKLNTEASERQSEASDLHRQPAAKTPTSNKPQRRQRTLDSVRSFYDLPSEKLRENQL
ncbi:hypothetical protein [Lentilactobacillus kosonis]|uniref:Uncharacterized protein n=1 Tax=Lentilactobacillus kosonis TaxID=2810561 RepID=A0A401FKE0_9LACO|nr:hypothetical protein [Lentilactobacillus kosonis]GAY72823.1 hypothetical protein NBRC111893_969 [Lentilactobacillus kosonis]